MWNLVSYIKWPTWLTCDLKQSVEEDVSKETELSEQFRSLCKYAMTTRESGGVAPPFLTSALDVGDWSALRPQPLYPRYPLCRRLGGSYSRSGCCWVEKISCRCRVSNPGRPGHSSSLYRLYYAGSYLRSYICRNFINYIGSPLLCYWNIAQNDAMLDGPLFILNKQSRTADKGWSFSLGVGRGDTSSSP
jgi:hypothetical protein